MFQIVYSSVKHVFTLLDVVLSYRSMLFVIFTNYFSLYFHYFSLHSFSRTFATAPCLFYPRRFSNRVGIISLLLAPLLLRLCGNMSLSPFGLVSPFSAPTSSSPWWIEPSYWNVWSDKTISRQSGNAFEKLCVHIRARLGKHTEMSCVES